MGFFCADVFLHQFGNHLVLLLELGLQPGDFLLAGRGLALGPSPSLLEERGGILEQDRLSLVDLVRLNAVLVTKVRDGDLLDQIPLEDGSLLVGTKVSSCRSHETLLA